MTSCKKDSSEVDQDKIFQKLTITYDEETNTTTYTANFYEDKENGRSIKLDDGSYVSVDGHEMGRSGTTYSHSVSGYDASAQFIFTDVEGNEYINTANATTYVTNDNDIYIDNNVPAYWTWGGDALDIDEEVDLVFRNNNDGTQISYNEDSYGQNTIAMSTASMNNMTLGLARATITRTKTVYTGNFTSVGGKILSSYAGVQSTVEFY